MAETKKPATKKPAAKKADEAPAEAAAPVSVKEAKKGGAAGLRVGAAILWLFAIAFEVLAILILNGNWEAFQNFLGTIFSDITTPLIIALVADLVLVVVGSQLWKAANHKDPVSEKNKLKFVLWNNMGVIVAIIAFLPLIIILLKNDKLDGKAKKLVTIIAVVAILIAAVCSIDFNPVSLEDMQTKASEGGYVGGDVYWTTFGKSYHLDANCQALSRTIPENLHNGALDDAFTENRTDPCDFCALNDAA